MNTPTLTLRRPRLFCSPLTGQPLTLGHITVRRRATPPAETDPTAVLQARITKLEAQLKATQQQAAESAQRHARVESITLRVVDRIAQWQAKQPRQRSVQITLTSQRIRTVDVWEQPHE